MRPTASLSADHRLIEQALDCLDVLSASALSTTKLEMERCEVVLEFLASFADQLHHGKEEQQLFPALQAIGMSADVGPIAVMLNEHSLGRAEHVRMRVAIDNRDAPGFAAAARGYVEVLRDHIAKEDGVLFPMAESRLSETTRTGLLQSFERADRELLGAGERECLVEAINALAQQLGVLWGAARPQTPKSHTCGML